MANMIDGLVGQLGPNGVSQIAKALNLDPAQAQGAIESALPALIGGLANNAARPEGAQALASALDDHDPGVFNQLGGLLGGGGPGEKILGHVLGTKRGGVEQQLSGQTGLDAGAIAKLLPVLAPLVLGYLSKQKKEENLDPGSLGSLLGRERSAIEAKQPGLGGLASILDIDLIDLTTDQGGKAKGGLGSLGGLGGLLNKVLKR